MKKAFIYLLLAGLPFFLMAQTEKIMSSQNGLEIAYKYQKIAEGGKDTYLITVTAINKNDYSLFYAVPTIVDANGYYPKSILWL